MLVCQMLRQKSAVSYEEIANDVCNQLRTTDEVSEARNIRRRAYDVINVMAAVGFIRKHKKRLFSVQSLVDENGVISMDILMKEREERVSRIAAKESCIQSAMHDMYVKQMEIQQQQKQKQQSLVHVRSHNQKDQGTGPTDSLPIISIKTEPVDEEEDGAIVTLNPDPDQQQVVMMETTTTYDPSLPDSPPADRQGHNVLVQQIGYVYTPYDYYGSLHYHQDPNLQDVSHSGQDVEVNYNRDPVEAILSAFY